MPTQTDDRQMQRNTCKLFCELSLLLHFLCAAPSCSQVPIEKSNGKIPAAWVWEVSSAVRAIYLVGEMHAFHGVREEDIDFELGHAIFALAPEVYGEARVEKPNPTPPSTRLSNILSSNTWIKLDLKVSTVIASMKLPPEKARDFRENLLAEFDSQSAAMAEANIRMLTGPAYLSSTGRKLPEIQRGLFFKLTSAHDGKKGKLGI